MFRRFWSGLPADPVFVPDLQELGYFVNDIDEIRSIDDPDYYFKFFLNKIDRWNVRQRFAFNEAVTDIIHTRLQTRGFRSVPLPIGTPPPHPHVPIFVSPDLFSKSRVVLLLGESCQALGVLAHRVIGGRGGIARGSVLGLVNALGAQQSSAANPKPPGVILANAGELWWWPEGARGLTPLERHGVPMASAVHYGRYHDGKVNEVPGHRSVGEHIRSVFETVVVGCGLVDEEAKVDVIVVGDTADDLKKYLDDDVVWARVGPMLGCLVVVGGVYSSKEFKCEGFKKFMEERARAYIIHHTPLDSPVAGPRGNPGAIGFTSYGCPVYSAGDALVTETMLIDAQPAVLKWIQQVALQGEAYKNEVVDILGDGCGITTEETDSSWGMMDMDTAEESEAGVQKPDIKPEGTVGSQGGEVPAQTEDGDAKDDKAQASGTTVGAQKTEENGSDGEAKNDGKPVTGKLDPLSFARDILGSVSKGDCPLPEDGPEGCGVVDLVKETEDLKLRRQ